MARGVLWSHAKPTFQLSCKNGQVTYHEATTRRMLVSREGYQALYLNFFLSKLAYHTVPLVRTFSKAILLDLNLVQEGIITSIPDLFTWEDACQLGSAANHVHDWWPWKGTSSGVAIEAATNQIGQTQASQLLGGAANKFNGFRYRIDFLASFGCGGISSNAQQQQNWHWLSRFNLPHNCLKEENCMGRMQTGATCNTVSWAAN